MTTFRTYDGNQSGFIDPGELGQALQTMGYRFSPTFVGFLSQKYVTIKYSSSISKTCYKRILFNRFGESGAGLPVDGFIMVCILIHKFTDGFRKKDASQQGVIQISYEDFLSLVLESWA